MTSSHAARASMFLVIAAIALATSAAWAQALGPDMPDLSADELSAPSPLLEGGAAPPRTTELERIRRERESLITQRQMQEAECYKKFAVEDCLRSVRAGAREVDARLRAQEIAIKDAERKEKAAERQRTIAEKQTSATPPEQGGKAGAASEVQRKPAMDRTPTAEDRAAQAARRAQEQRDKIQQRSQAQKASAAGDVEREDQSRARYAEKLRKAQERRDKADASREQEQASGKQPAAPLPPVPAASR